MLMRERRTTLLRALNVCNCGDKNKCFWLYFSEAFLSRCSNFHYSATWGPGDCFHLYLLSTEISLVTLAMLLCTAGDKIPKFFGLTLRNVFLNSTICEPGFRVMNPYLSLLLNTRLSLFMGFQAQCDVLWWGHWVQTKCIAFSENFMD